MRLADYRDKTREAEEARNALAVMTASIERSRGLYGYDVKPAPRFRSGRLAYEAETERMAGRLGLLGKIGTAQAALGQAGLAKEGTIGGYRELGLGQIGAAREHKLGTLGAAKLGAEADIFGYETGAKTDVAVERLRGQKALEAAYVTADAATRKAIDRLLAEGNLEGILGLLGGKVGAAKAAPGEADDRLSALMAEGIEETPEEAAEAEAVRRYFPDKTPSLFEVKQAAKKRLGVVPTRIRRAKELSERLGTW